MGPFGNGSSRDGGHHYAEGNVKHALGVVFVRVTNADELFLAQYTSFGLNTEPESHNEKGQAGNGHNQDCLEENE